MAAILVTTDFAGRVSRQTTNARTTESSMIIRRMPSPWPIFSLEAYSNEANQLCTTHGWPGAVNE